MQRQAWLILHMHGQRLIVCLLCERWSANPHDIAERFCGYCKVWLEDIPLDYTPHPVGPVGTPRLQPVADEVPEWRERGHRR